VGPHCGGDCGGGGGLAARGGRAVGPSVNRLLSLLSPAAETRNIEFVSVADEVIE
jgi:hypothetical protein